MPKFIDLTGQRFGKLVVIERAENIGNNTAWLCQCDCGNLKIIQGRSLKGEKTFSCGCGQKAVARKLSEKMRKKLKDSEVEGVRTPALRRRKLKAKTSKYKGCSFDDHWGKWRAYIQLKGKILMLGGYQTEDEAHSARIMAEKILFRPFLLKEAELKKKTFLIDVVGFSEEEAMQFLEIDELQKSIEKAFKIINGDINAD